MSHSWVYLVRSGHEELKVSGKENAVLKFKCYKFPSLANSTSGYWRHENLQSSCLWLGGHDSASAWYLCIWERRSLPHNCTQLLRSCWGRMCLITDGYYSGYTTNSNFKQACCLLVNCLETICVKYTMESCIWLLAGAIHHYFNFTRSESMRREV